MQDNGLKYTLLMSMLLHIAVLFFISMVYVAKNTGKTVYLTEITLMGEMPYGKGLGQKGQSGESIGKKSGDIAIKNVVDTLNKTKVNTVKIEKAAPISKEDIIKIRESSPIGIDRNVIKTSGGPVDGPVYGGGYGDDNEKPGSPDGNPEIIGPIASRGIRHSDYPSYPEWAKKRGIEGEVQVQITVTPKGDVGDIAVLKTCGFKDLDQLVISCMRKWKFDSLPMSASQIEQEGMITFKFNLKK